MDDNTRKFIQTHLGYQDEEMEMFLSNPKNVEILSKAPALMQKTIVAEVVESHGCNSQHQIGDKFYFDGVGNLITKLNPKRICIHVFVLYGQSGLFFVPPSLDSMVGHN